MNLSGNKPSEVYLKALELVLREGQPIRPREQLCYELEDLCIEIKKPSSAPLTTRDPMRDHRMAKYLAHEFELYNRAENRCSEFAKVAPFWKDLANPDGTINSCYGKIIWHDETIGRESLATCRSCAGKGCDACGFIGAYPEHDKMTPWEWAIYCLAKDRDSRQAVLLFMRPDHLFDTKDVVCTLHGYFSIRRNELNLSMVMRSNDLVRGFAYDAPWFMSLQEKMLVSLLPAYPSLTLGVYRHMAHSAHIYERDTELAWGMLGMTPPKAEPMPDLDHVLDLFKEQK